MNQKANFKTVTLKDLWGIFVQRLWAIILAACICCGGFLVFNRMTFVPQYASTATLYILRQADGATASDASSDFSLALKVVNDCTYLLKSHTVLDEVISSLNLDMEYEDLYDCVSTSNPEDTRILEVTVKADSPELAKRIVDRICTIGSKRIEDAMGFQQVNLYELGTTDPDPCNSTRMLTFAFAGVVAAVVTYVIFLIISSSMTALRPMTRIWSDIWASAFWVTFRMRMAESRENTAITRHTQRIGPQPSRR